MRHTFYSERKRNYIILCQSRYDRANLFVLCTDVVISRVERPISNSNLSGVHVFSSFFFLEQRISSARSLQNRWIQFGRTCSLQRNLPIYSLYDSSNSKSPNIFIAWLLSPTYLRFIIPLKADHPHGSVGKQVYATNRPKLD